MALLSRWREPQMMRQLRRAWDPERLMREVLEADPFARMEPLIQLRPPEGWFTPDIDLKETKDGFEVRADLPGVKESDIDISVSGRRLSISGKREEEKEERKGERYYAYERASGAFCRSFTLPEDADLDKIQADLREGVLRVNVPKTTASQPKKIPVQAGKTAEEPAAAKKGEAQKAA